MATIPNLSPDAREIYTTFGKAAGWPIITWGSVRHGCSFGADMMRIARAWNELTEKGYARGQLSKGEACRIVG